MQVPVPVGAHAEGSGPVHTDFDSQVHWRPLHAIWLAAPSQYPGLNMHLPHWQPSRQSSCARVSHAAAVPPQTQKHPPAHRSRSVMALHCVCAPPLSLTQVVTGQVHCPSLGIHCGGQYVPGMQPSAANWLQFAPDIRVQSKSAPVQDSVHPSAQPRLQGNGVPTHPGAT